MGKKLKYGVIGTGNIVPKHLNGYSALSDSVDIVACCDINAEKMNAVADKYNIPNRFENYKDLLAMKELDFVSVCLPNYLHAPISIEAMEAGLHVHCEKPMAVSLKAAEAMLKARNRTGRCLMIGLNNRFTIESQYTRQLIEAGFLGKIYFAKCGWQRRSGLPHAGWFTNKEQSGGGPLIDLGVHFIDLVLSFMGYPAFTSLSARTFNYFGGTSKHNAHLYPGVRPGKETIYNVEDMATGFINLKNDASLQFEVSWASNIEKEKVFYELYGTEGGVRFENDFSGTPTFKAYRIIEGQQVDVVPKLNSFAFKTTEFNHFVESIQKGVQPQIVKAEECVQMMELIEAIYQSANEKMPIVRGGTL